MSKNPFCLNKWFLDCVTDDGHSYVFYSARLEWRGLKVYYTSQLQYNPTAGNRNRSWLRQTPEPTRDQDQITWSDPRNDIFGTWTSRESPLMARLVDQKEGYLDWQCWQPCSSVQLQVDGEQLSGLGYVEELTMTVPPWRIPMTQLRWGQYAALDDSMVWIQLIGESDQTWVWRRGRECHDVRITDDALAISAEGVELTLHEKVPLESEKKILSTVRTLMRILPGFVRSIPHSFLFADETKWLSKGCLTTAEGPLNTGWAIHEFVDFNPPG